MRRGDEKDEHNVALLCIGTIYIVTKVIRVYCRLHTTYCTSTVHVQVRKNHEKKNPSHVLKREKSLKTKTPRSVPVEL